ncbi:MAG: tRNA guanosine(34) transglycosylase Tgt [Candidatus Acetothermia bacterium]|jgi:queuine tRNA-ribosyltransferase/7-cyano-7-deazaguanine tRNA-ribosyltransferase|nr:tRNA guanosine(34) transglycosylase Tgt [Candidatus Acetothermia bacterium]MDH7506137.1 tRNA guanosine(34) transglycosylase Tgt [Candidatus Acetothermia bacterium]
MFEFEIAARDGGARAGRLITPHGAIETPSFVAVGTQGTVKAVSPEELRAIGVQVIIANTYHLHLQPGEDLIEKLGGLHRFMNWNGPLMTDSGGFQVFSLGAGREHGVGKIAPIFPEEEARLRDRGGHFRAADGGKPLVKVDEDGVEFISHLDGSRHRFTPEKVIQIERKLGADIILVLDECTSPLHDYAYTKEALERTHRWALRALREFERADDGRQALFGIVQGGAYRDLREASARFISSLDFHGFAIGGSLGKSKQEMLQVLEWTVPLLPEGRPRHLLGIGEIADIFAAVQRGIDMFDCVAPTRMARNGALFSREAEAFRLHIRNARYRDDPRPVEAGCGCYTCRNYSRAYLRHLFEAKELLAMRLATIHNLYFLEELMRQVRAAIREGHLAELKREWLP